MVYSVFILISYHSSKFPFTPVILTGRIHANQSKYKERRPLMKEVTYFFDMDGVLAKWDTSASEEETHQRGYFASRDLELSALALVRLLKDSGRKVKILSAVYEDDHSRKEKREWLDASGLSDVESVFVPYGEKKSSYVDEDFPVLVDDYSKNLREWEQEGHLPVKFFNGINNQPKFKVVDNVVQVEADTWSGYSLDNRMSPAQMFTLLTAVAEKEAENEKSVGEVWYDMR